jgi:hypothetical protein
MPFSPPIPVINKSPSALLDYGFDLSARDPSSGSGPWLQPGETITALTVTADAGVTVASSGIYPNASGVQSQVVAWVSGGTIGTEYNVYFLFTSSAGRQDTRTLTLNVVQR